MPCSKECRVGLRRVPSFDEACFSHGHRFGNFWQAIDVDDGAGAGTGTGAGDDFGLGAGNGAGIGAGDGRGEAVGVGVGNGGGTGVDGIFRLRSFAARLAGLGSIKLHFAEHVRVRTHLSFIQLKCVLSETISVEETGWAVTLRCHTSPESLFKSVVPVKLPSCSICAAP